MTFIKRYPYFTIWILFIVIILVIILLFIVYNKINKLEKLETFENDPSETISVSIGNEICRYFYYMGLAILEQKDFTYDRIFDETYKKISLDMTQTQFQREVGRLEVLGELLIREK
jgi:hypothetical protein